MKIQNQFVPLDALIHSLGNHRRIYFLYRQAAESGLPGARLRFHFFKRSLTKGQLKAVEVLFKTSRPQSTVF